MRIGVGSRRTAASRMVLLACVFLGGVTAPSIQPALAAEFSTGPWVKGYTDIFGGIVPPVAGFYFRTDAYHYEGSADRVSQPPSRLSRL
jgi:hypothetical protein